MEFQCEALISLLGAERILLPSSNGYNSSLVSYFSPQASAVKPLCFVLPKTVDDVSAIVKVLASNSSCNFAVRGGGHMWFPGASTSSGGVTIDLRGLNSIELSPDYTSISIGIGATWDTVYAKLDPLGRSVAGGRVAGVGIGGLTLGGGLSYFGPRYGWTCNQAKSFEVVLAEGSVIQASATQNADLWKGLRGGLNNFGIVTRVEFVTFEQGDVWSALTINPTTVVDQQAQLYAQLMASENYDVNASFLTGWAFSAKAGGSVALNQLVYTKPYATEDPPFYRQILDLPAVPGIGSPAVVTNMSTHAQNSVALNAPQASRYLMATTTFVPTEAMIRETYAAFSASLAAVRDLPGMKWMVNLEPLPPQIYARGAADNCLGLADRTGSLVVCLLCPAWPNAEQDAQVEEAARTLIADIEARAKQIGVYDPYLYLGYAAPWQNVIASYGAESVAQLRNLRARVDPHEVFTRLVPGGFKIPSSTA